MTDYSQNILDGFYAGNSKIIEVEITDTFGNPIDLTNAIATYGMVNSKDEWVVQKSSSLSSEIDIIDPTNGVLQVFIEPSDTLPLYGTFIHHLNIVDVNGNESTVLAGRVNIFKSYARRYSYRSLQAYLSGG